MYRIAIWGTLYRGQLLYLQIRILRVSNIVYNIVINNCIKILYYV